MATMHAWWGSGNVRHFVPATTFETAIVNLSRNPVPANIYAPLPGAGTDFANAPHPFPSVGVDAIRLAHWNTARLPILHGVAAWRFWGAGGGVPAFNASVAGAGLPPIPVAGACVAAANRTTAATLAMGAAPVAVKLDTMAANGHYAPPALGGGGAAVPLSDVSRTVHAQFGGPAVAPPPGSGAWLNPVPLHVPPTQLTQALPIIGAVVDLEHVMVRYTMQHLLAAGGTVSNGAGLQLPVAWSASPEPICITWSSVAGGPFGAHDRSLLWWGGPL